MTRARAVTACMAGLSLVPGQGPRAVECSTAPCMVQALGDKGAKPPECKQQ